MIALQLWCAGANGPDGLWMRAQFSKFNAGIVAAQAALSFVPNNSSIEDLDSRLQLIEQVETDQQQTEETGSATHAAAAAIKQTSDDIEQFRATLAEISNTIGCLQSELQTKATQLDTSSALDLLRRELLKLASTMVGKGQLAASLNSKLDRRDLRQIAALIANGELDGLNPFVYNHASASSSAVFCPSKSLRLQPSYKFPIFVVCAAIGL